MNRRPAGRVGTLSCCPTTVELVGECSFAMESDTVPGAYSASYGEIESGRGDHPRLEHAVKAFVRSAHLVGFRQRPVRKHGACRLGLEGSSTAGRFCVMVVAVLEYASGCMTQ